MATHSSILAWRIPGIEEPLGCHLWGRTESDMTDVTWQQQQQQVTNGEADKSSQVGGLCMFFFRLKFYYFKVLWTFSNICKSGKNRTKNLHVLVPTMINSWPFWFLQVSLRLPLYFM